jgi:outer membrane receptor for ferrienterochelin and colicin
MNISIFSSLATAYLWVLLLLGTGAGTLLAQSQATGQVYDQDGEPLIGATVKRPDGTGAVTDAGGAFELPLRVEDKVLVFSYVGFQPVTVEVATAEFPLTVTMNEGSDLAAVEVTARNKGSFTSLLDGRNVESLTSKELRKAPCCTLAESFENSAVVDLTYGDPLTGRREIQMLGLRGNYTQVTFEKFPMLGGLATPYAMDIIPGTWVDGIQISKGSGSSESGASGLSGQINTELKKPTIDAPVFVNLFANSQNRFEGNLHLNKALTNNLSIGAYLHSSTMKNDHDRDFDTFKDMPDRESNVGMLRLFRRNPADNWEGQWNVLVAKDIREGGQRTAHDHGQATLDPYVIRQDNQRVEVFGKTGYFGFAHPSRSIGFMYSGAYHRLNNLYGRNIHQAEQQSLYFNTLYHTDIRNEKHKLSLGGTVQTDRFDEVLSDVRYDRTETVAGANAEYLYSAKTRGNPSANNNFTAIVGLRVDHHSLGGWQASPRVNIKYNLSEYNALRVSAGRGWRSPNVLVENVNRLPSSRQVRMDAAPQGAHPGFMGLERAWNVGANMTQEVRVRERAMTFVLDFYRTDFQNQIVVDVEQDLASIFLYQLEGRSFSNSFMGSMEYELLPRVDVKLAYKYNDVRTEYRQNGLREVPQVPRHRALATVDYDGKRWRANVNYQWIGQQRLPDHDLIPSTVYVSQSQVAPSFGLLNTQLTYVANSKLELYAGVENITNVYQQNAIIGAYEPFDGDYFDATQVYQPLNQRMYFLGLRYTAAK